MNPSTLSVTTWNVLADCYAHRSAEVGDNGPISWKNRSLEIAKCLKECNSDVLCLQEVDHYDDFYKKCLRECGYRPCFVQRPQRQDGCVIAFKQTKFQLTDLVQVSCDDAISADSLYEHQKYEKHNVALILKLKDLQAEKEVIVATCHIHWNPMLPEVKMSQIVHILEKLKEYQEGDVPVVLTGDFNTLPSDPIYAAITSSVQSVYTHTVTTANKVTINTTSAITFPYTLPMLPTTTMPNNITLLHTMLQNVRYGGAFYGPKTRFLCDASLSKLCKWLRVLGVNCALDSWDNGVPASSTKHRNAAKWQWTSVAGADGANSTINGVNGTGDNNNTTANADVSTSLVPGGAGSNSSDASPTPSTSTTPTTPTPTTSTSPVKGASAAAKEAHRAQFPIPDPTYAARIHSINTFFARAEREKRVILTTSRSLRERSSCPKSFFIQAQKLEQGLIDICVVFGLDLNRDRFLTVCGKCGDDVEEVDRTIEPVTGECTVHDSRLVDKYMPTDRTVFACVNCAQPYWWNEKVGSLPALAMERAEQLYSMVCKGIAKRNGVTATDTSVSISDTSGVGSGVVATPTIYQDDSLTKTNINTDHATRTDITTFTTPTATTPTTNVPLSPPFQPKKAVPQAGTCILKDFGRTAMNPTLKNPDGDNSTSGKGEAVVVSSSRSRMKSAELELERIRMSKLSVCDRSCDGTNAADGTATTNNTNIAGTAADATSTTTTTPSATTNTTTITTTPAPASNILTSNTPSMSISTLSQMFKNRERSMKLVKEGGSSNSDGISTSTSNTELNELCDGGSNSGTNSHSSTNCVEGIALQSVFQLLARTANTDVTATDADSAAISNSTAVDTTTIGLSGVECEPELTNWNGGFKGTLDYIFVSEHVRIRSAPRVVPTIHTSNSTASTATDNTIDTSNTSVTTSAANSTATTTHNTTSATTTTTLLTQVLTQAQPSAQWPSDHFMVSVVLDY